MAVPVSGPLTSMTLHQLRIFAAVAEQRSFRRAAEALYMSEPTVSDQIKLLESLVGIRLLERGPGRRQVELTEPGRVLLGTCESVFQSLGNAVAEINAFKGLEKGSVGFGTDVTFGGYLLPSVLDTFRRSQPGVGVRVQIDHRTRILEGLRQRALDLAVLVAPIDGGEFITEPLAPCDLVLVGPPGHRLAQSSLAPFSELACEQLIVPDRSAPLRQAVEQLAADKGVPLDVVLEVANLDARKHAVLSGLGIAILVSYTVAEEVAAGQLALLRVEGFPARLDWLIVTRPRVLSPAAGAFRTHLLTYRDALLQGSSFPYLSAAGSEPA